MGGMDGAGSAQGPVGDLGALISGIQGLIRCMAEAQDGHAASKREILYTLAEMQAAQLGTENEVQALVSNAQAQRQTLRQVQSDVSRLVIHFSV